MIEQRENVVAEARRWLGAKWKHDALIPYKLCDCGRLLEAVYTACGLIEKPDVGHYSRQWALHQTEESFLAIIERYAQEVESPLPGDLALFKVIGAKTYSHAAIVIDWPVIIHAHIVAGVVEDDVVRSQMAGVPVKFFSVISCP